MTVEFETSLKIFAKIWSNSKLGRRNSSCNISKGINVVCSRTVRARAVRQSERGGKWEELRLEKDRGFVTNVRSLGFIPNLMENQECLKYSLTCGFGS